MTTVHLSERNWKKINSLKQPGESVDDVVTRILQMSGYYEEKILDNRKYSEILDEFVNLQNDRSSLSIDDIIEQSKHGWK